MLHSKPRHVVFTTNSQKSNSNLSKYSVNCGESTGDNPDTVESLAILQGLPSLPDFEIFKQAIARECIEESGIAENLFNVAVEFHTDLA